MNVCRSARRRGEIGPPTKGLGVSAKRILVVDDNPDIAGIMRLAVGKLDRPVEVVSELDPQRALRILDREEFDLVIADYRMREMDGLELLTLARPPRGHEKRLLYTAYPAKLDAALLASARLDGFMEKPMLLAALRSVIDAVLDGDPATLAALKRALDARTAEAESRAAASAAARSPPSRP